MRGPSTTTTPSNPDARRREARRLENEIDSKLVLFSREQTSSALQNEIERALQDLVEVNDQMSRDAASSVGGTATSMHMLQRHREILHDFQQEFSRTRSARREASMRDQLLSSVRQDILEHRSAATRASEALLRERTAIHGSDRAAADVLEQAAATRDALAAQRGGFAGMGGKLRQLSSLAPQVNSLIGQIGRRKKRDQAVIAVVVGGCCAMIFIWTFG